MIKIHYIFRNRAWWVFQSLAVAREFLATAQLPNGYRIDLEPRLIRSPRYPDPDVMHIRSKLNE